MRKIKEILTWFIFITPGILLLCAIIFTINGSKEPSPYILWQILLSGFITALATAFLLPQKAQPRGRFLIKCIPHYLSLCIIMMLLGVWFGWMEFSLPNVMVMCIWVAIVYVCVFGLSYVMNKKESDEINSRLKEKYSEKKEE